MTDDTPKFTKDQLKTIIDIADKICSQHTFSYYERDDIKQEIFLIALDGLKSYDSSKSNFNTFMYTHINNRLVNLKHKKFFNPNSAKAATERMKVQSPSQQDNMDSNISSFEFESFIETLEIENIYEHIDNKLHAKYREDYLKLKEGVLTNLMHKERVCEAIRKIIENLDD